MAFGQQARPRENAGVTRREFLFASAALLLGACSLPSGFVPVHEASRRMAKGRAPAFVPGRTKYPDAVAALRKAGVTNLVASVGELPDGKTEFRALAGDYLNRLYIFEGLEFVREIPLHAHPGTDRRLYVKAVEAGGRGAVMVVGPELADKRGNIGIIVVAADRSGEFATIPFTNFPQWASGAALPVIQGSSLDTGVYFTARDGNGAAWYHAYLISHSGGKITVGKPANSQSLLSCGCMRDWFFEPEKWLAQERRAAGL